MNNYTAYMALYIGTIFVFTGFVLLVNSIWTKRHQALKRQHEQLNSKVQPLVSGLFDIANTATYVSNTYRQIAKSTLIKTSGLSWDQIMTGEKKDQEAKAQEIREQMLYPREVKL